MIMIRILSLIDLVFTLFGRYSSNIISVITVMGKESCLEAEKLINKWWLLTIFFYSKQLSAQFFLFAGGQMLK